MKFMAGYQLRRDEDWIHALIDHRADLNDVFFSWGDSPSGRGVSGRARDMSAWEALNRQRKDLGMLSAAGIKLNLLLNANCYGEKSQSRALFEGFGDLIDDLSGSFALTSITTTSPLIARFVKENFPQMEVRASVNMSIGTVQGMETVRDYFDSFYMQREYNHDLKRIKKLRAWCDAQGKKLYVLANSGCFNYCAAHHFHDNLVAHEREIAQMDNAMSFRGVCWEMLDSADGRRGILARTNFIRPEDMALYEGLFDAAKLATRVSANPMRILDAYIQRRHLGSTFELCEPNHSGALYPELIENSLIPADFGQRRLECDGECEVCGYCMRVYDQAQINLNEEGALKC